MLAPQSNDKKQATFTDMGRWNRGRRHLHFTGDHAFIWAGENLTDSSKDLQGKRLWKVKTLGGKKGKAVKEWVLVSRVYREGLTDYTAQSWGILYKNGLFFFGSILIVRYKFFAVAQLTDTVITTKPDFFSWVFCQKEDKCIFRLILKLIAHCWFYFFFF